MAKKGRPANATTALVPAASRGPERINAVEEELSGLAIETFAKAVGGRATLADVLTVAGSSPDVEKVSLLLLDRRYQDWSLRRICALTGITVSDLFTAYRKAMIARSHIEATHVITRHSVAVVEDVMTRAIPQRQVCPKCLGTSAAGQGPCPICQSTGYIQSEPDLDRQKVALELAQLIEKKGGGILMQQNTIAAGALASTGTGALEQLHQAVGDLLFSPSRRRTSAPVIEAQIAEPPDTNLPRTEPEPPWPLPIPEPEPEEPDDDDENGGGGQFGAGR